MTFASPHAFWLLIGSLALAGWLVRGRIYQARELRALRLFGRMNSSGGWLIWWAGLFLVVGLARPQSATGRDDSGIRGRDLVLAFDVSLSMGVEDAIPTRLGAAVEAARTLLQALAQDESSRVGVVAFAGKGVPRCPLTQNLGAVREVIERLSPGEVRPGGTDLGAGLEAAFALLKPAGVIAGQTIMLFSDGEDHAGRYQAIAQTLADRGIVVHTVAVGDDHTGRNVPTRQGNQMLTYQGQPVLSTRFDPALRQIAETCGGTFLPLGVHRADLGVIYLSRIEPTARPQTINPWAERTEWFGLPLGIAASLVVWGSWQMTRGRTARVHKPVTAPPKIRSAEPATVLAIVLLALAARGDGPPAKPARPADLISQGLAHYKKREFQPALEVFNRAVKLEPRRAIPRFNRAATLFQLGRYREAMHEYLLARRVAGPALQVKIDFAIGNTALALGEIDLAIAFYDACLGSKARGPDLARVRADAAANRAFALAQSSPRSTTELSTAAPTKEGSPRFQQAPTGTPESAQGERAPAGSRGQAGSSQAQRDNPDRPRQDASGGAGGSANQPPKPPPGSPEDRLKSALDHIRDAQLDRLPDDQSPTRETAGDHKDW